MKTVFPVCLLALTGCVTSPPAPVIPCPTRSVATVPVAERVHTARYTLVDIAPPQALRFPLRQITSKTLPKQDKRHLPLSREAALRGWLNGTGYGLCMPVSAAMRLFYSGPLPESQRSMGPMRTDAALATIAGAAWVMTTDEVSRTICWQPSPDALKLS